MNWWIIIQVGQWLSQWNSPPQGYLLSDEAFFAQPISQQTLVLDKPDTVLLDMALFQATNEARRLAGLPILQYDRSLYQAARNHAESMMQNNYISHEDHFDLSGLTLLKRIQKQTNRFGVMAENIGQYQTIDTPDWFGVRFNSRRQQYEFVNSATKQPYKPYSYASYARYAVIQWLNSPHHRANLLNPLFTHVGCAVRLSAHPFKERRAPFGRLVQNFGSPRVTTQARR
ncbi:CAP domain-containing protein [Spirosoma sp. KNUC1025]|uniref:CAP domain-containing protein n=1 Tax=Spirosoma sp. KNUC1025 TaxID=2894082 RepID=UPI00387062ED|nr:CAP domain-containing protein [Spirosoma sp. KNUC1025]